MKPYLASVIIVSDFSLYSFSRLCISVSDCFLIFSIFEYAAICVKVAESFSSNLIDRYRDEYLSVNLFGFFNQGLDTVKSRFQYWHHN